MRVKRWETLADGIMDSAIVVRNERLRPPEKQEPANIALHDQAVTAALAHIAGQLGSRAWLEGDAISLGDLALFSALVYLDLRQPERDWRGAHPDLSAWFTRLRARPAVQASLPE
jgi:glutathione S-transferase